MQHILLAFYILFFSTGFMGGAALLVLGLKVRSRLLRPLLVFQVLFLIGLGFVVVYFYLLNILGGSAPRLSLPFAFASAAINTALYIVAILLVLRMSPRSEPRRGYPNAAVTLSGLVILKTAVTLVLVAGFEFGYTGPSALAGSEAWSLGGYLLTGLALAAIGIVMRGPLSPDEPPAVQSLLKAYGLCALVFAPAGLIEYAVQTADIPGLSFISLDHFFYLAWNCVSMSAAIRLFRRTDSGIPLMDSVPEERIHALGLSRREIEMAVMIARGLANKEIAAELNISPATVRTHIYNLYRKAGARSRVELLNLLRR